MKDTKDKSDETEPTEMTEAGGSEWEGLSPAEAKLKMARQLDGMDAGGIFDVPGTKGRVMTTLHEHVAEERKETDRPKVTISEAVHQPYHDTPVAEKRSSRVPLVAILAIIVLVLWAIYTILR